MDVSEEELLAAIRRVLAGAGPEIRVGPGDDAAVIGVSAGAELLVTTDVLVEGVHFDRALSAARDLGYKAIVASVSDVAAMAGSPRAAVCALALRDEVSASWAVELLGGMRDACSEHALWLVGGDLSRGPAVTIAVTVTGEVAPGAAVLRSGASPGDVLVVTGALGASAAGLRVARGGSVASALDRELLRAHFRPTARVGEARVLARHGATAMIDLSDGLALDLSRVCRASRVGARVRLVDVPVADGATPGEALGGGEDYELLAALPRGAVDGARAELRDAFGVSLAAIGDIIDGEGLVAVEADGAERPLEPEGWDHFGG
jgi:thiamine-monophosphate kinase